MMTDYEKQAVEKALSNGTEVMEAKACKVCGCTHYYVRHDAGYPRKNGCIVCKAVKAEAKMRKTMMVDENGVGVYLGKACSVCGGYTRLSDAAYGAKKGACRECALEKQITKEYGKEFARLQRKSNHHTHNFLVGSIERSGTVLVAPQNRQQFYEVLDLIYRCDLMNEREKVLETGIRWEVGHKYPACVAGEMLVGKATVENLYIVESRQNKIDGNLVPDEWETCQVVSIQDCRKIATSYEAAKAWKEHKAQWEKTATKADRAARDAAEKEVNTKHRALVSSLVSHVSDSLMAFFEDDYLPTFETMHKAVNAQWVKFSLHTHQSIESCIKAGIKREYKMVRGQRVEMEAFVEGNARLSLINQTFDQLADAESILKEMMMRGQAVDMVALSQVKRFAVEWAEDVLRRPKNVVMGFAHPLLDVLGDWKVWGTKKGEDGLQHLCPWRKPSLEGGLTPFDEMPDLDLVNKVLLSAEYREPVMSEFEAVKWENTSDIWLYERQVEKAKRLEMLRKMEEAAAEKAAAVERAKARVGSDKAALKMEMAAAIEALEERVDGFVDEWPLRIGRDFVMYAWVAKAACDAAIDTATTPEEFEKIKQGVKAFQLDLSWRCLQSVLLDPFKGVWWRDADALANHLARFC